MTQKTHDIDTALKKIEKLALAALKEHDFFQESELAEVTMETSEEITSGFDRVVSVSARKQVKSTKADGLQSLMQLYLFKLKPVNEGVVQFESVLDIQYRVESKCGLPRISCEVNQADNISTLLSLGSDQFAVHSMIRMGLFDDYKGLTLKSCHPSMLRVGITAAPDRVREIVGLDDQDDIELLDLNRAGNAGG